MKKPTQLIILFTLSLFTIKTYGQCSGTYIILKMDDVRANTNDMYNASWQRYADSIRSYGVKSGMGMVTVDLTTGSQTFKDSLTSWHNSDVFEVWHHGWDHIRNNYPPGNNNAGEFSGTPYDYQKDHLEDGMAYAQSELGITLKTFGAPYNQTDNTFLTVLEENDDIKVWLYCNDPSYSEMCLERGSSNLLESSTGVVSYSSFLTAYSANTNPYLVVQGHPGAWDNNSFDEFDQVISYLKSQGDCFILPYEYYQLVNNLNVVYSENFDNPDSLYISSGSDEVDALSSCCGEGVFEMKSGQTLSSSEPIVIPIHDEGVASIADISNNKKLYLRVRSENAMDIRVDLSDGTNSTSGANGQITQSISAGTNDWSLLTYDFVPASFSDNNVDSTQISEIHIYPDAGNDDFSGKIYIDFISIGDVSGSVAQCRTDLDADPCTSIYEDQFDDEIVTVSGSHLANIDADESACGELKLEMKSGSTLGTYKPILYNFPGSIDFTQNPKLVVRVRCASSMVLRFDLHDGINATNGVSGRVSNIVPADINNWSVLEYNFSPAAFAENGVDSTAITRLNIQLDPANENFPGPLYIDYIAVGQQSDLNNAVYKTDLENCDGSITPVDKKQGSGYLIYPNPSRDRIRIVGPDFERLSLKIYDIVGNVAFTQKGVESNESIDLSNLTSGSYLLSINNSKYSRLVIE